MFHGNLTHCKYKSYDFSNFHIESNNTGVISNCILPKLHIVHKKLLSKVNQEGWCVWNTAFPDVEEWEIYLVWFWSHCISIYELRMFWMLECSVLDFCSEQQLIEQMMQLPQHPGSEFTGTYMPKYLLNFILLSSFEVNDFKIRKWQTCPYMN